MQKTTMLVTCITDAENRCAAIFEADNRTHATKIRKCLFSLLPHDCHSSVGAFVETKQHYFERRAAVSMQIGLPLAPVKWFAPGDTWPERFEDLQVAPEVLQSYLEEYKIAINNKPASYWGTL